MRILEFSSSLKTDRDAVWRAVLRMDGVNAELMPLIRMTYPREAGELSLSDAPIGTLAFKSWILAFGFLPFDLHALTLAEVRDNGFVEESTSWVQRRWRHERRVEATPAGCAVHDRLTFEPRVRLFEPVVAAIVGVVFRHRHRRLKARFGEAE